MSVADLQLTSLIIIAVMQDQTDKFQPNFKIYIVLFKQ